MAVVWGRIYTFADQINKNHKMKAFKAYDIRGVYGRDFTREDVYKIGFFLPKLLHTKKVLVGRDMRLSSPEIYEYLTRGITDAGANVTNLGLATTPMVYHFTCSKSFRASVQITASHNPMEYNGLKICREDAKPVSYETGLQELERMVEREPVVITKPKGTITDVDWRMAYRNYVRKWFFTPFRLKTAIDCSDGMTSILAREFFGDYKVTYINDTPDGNFPHHQPNPLEAKNRKDIVKLVKETGAEIGIIFDGDGDRAMFIDEKGNFVQPDYIIALISLFFTDILRTKRKLNVLHDIRTSRSVIEYLISKGIEPHMWRVGRAYAVPMMPKKLCTYGGELAGHYYFSFFHNCDNGFIAAFLVVAILEHMRKQGETFSSLIDKIKKYANSGEINYRVADKDKDDIISEIRVHFAFFSGEKPTAVYDFDGYRIEYSDWWFNVRKSNTEPYLRVIVEARTEEMMKARLAEIDRIIRAYKNL